MVKALVKGKAKVNVKKSSKPEHNSGPVKLQPKFESDGCVFKTKLMLLYYLRLKELMANGFIQSFDVPHQTIETDEQGNERYTTKELNGKKLNSSKCYINGIEFDSVQESKFYLFLMEKKATGKIIDFLLQPTYVLMNSYRRKEDNKMVRKMTYSADFLVMRNDESIVAIDTKGFETDTFKIKRKLYDFLHEHLPEMYPKLVLIKIRERIKGDAWFKMDSDEEIR